MQQVPIVLSQTEFRLSYHHGSAKKVAGIMTQFSKAMRRSEVAKRLPRSGINSIISGLSDALGREFRRVSWLVRSNT